MSIEHQRRGRLREASRNSQPQRLSPQLCTRAAGLFSVVFNERYAPAQVHAFIDALKLFKIGYSWAGPVSLAVPYQLAAMRQEPAYRGTLVRFSVGLEAVGDLIADCQQAVLALGP